MVRTPDEDARVPDEAAGGQETFRGGPIGLLAKLDHAMNGDSVPPLGECAALDVTVARLGAGGRDAEGHKRAGIVVDDRDRGLDRRAKGIGGLDHVVGRHDDHGTLCVLMSDDARRETDAGRRVARAGFGDDVFARQVGKLFVSGPCLVGSRDDDDPIPRDQWFDPSDRLLQHGRAAGQAKQLLGPVAPALGPESGPAAAGHDDRV